MENHASNPAGRLFVFFDQMIRRSPDFAISQYAAEYFQSEPFDAKYLAATASMMRLPDEVETLVAGLEDPPISASKLLRPLENVRNYFRADPLGTQAIRSMINTINSGVLSDLETTSQILGKYVTKKTDIDQDTLDSIRSLADEIARLAAEDTLLTADAREAIIRYAQRLKTAVDLYKVTGAQALIDELDRFFSEAQRVRPTPSKPLLKKLGTMVGAIVMAAEIFTGPADVADAIEQYTHAFELEQSVQAPGEHADFEDQPV